LQNPLVYFCGKAQTQVFEHSEIWKVLTYFYNINHKQKKISGKVSSSIARITYHVFRLTMWTVALPLNQVIPSYTYSDLAYHSRLFNDMRHFKQILSDIIITMIELFCRLNIKTNSKWSIRALCSSLACCYLCMYRPRQSWLISVECWTGLDPTTLK
jgi:hypothetical protein